MLYDHSDFLNHPSIPKEWPVMLPQSLNESNSLILSSLLCRHCPGDILALYQLETEIKPSESHTSLEL